MPEKKSGVVMFTNSENGLSIIRKVVADALGGEQPAFDWLKYDNYDAPGVQFLRVARQQGAAAALKQFNAELSSGAIPEGTINQEGYNLMGRKQIADAILVFQKNVEVHPTSSNVYDSLGEAYMNNGQTDLSIKNYEKALELNPNSANAVAMLKKLRDK